MVNTVGSISDVPVRTMNDLQRAFDDARRSPGSLGYLELYRMQALCYRNGYMDAVASAFNIPAEYLYEVLEENFIARHGG